VDFDATGKPIQNLNAIYTFTDATMQPFYQPAAWSCLAGERSFRLVQLDRPGGVYRDRRSANRQRTGIASFDSTILNQLFSLKPIPPLWSEMPFRSGG
jgi:hypothetical protein